ncbi:APC family permease [Actinomycetospora straminea]|uniref:APC family permease n=1 Tax=Actinomycetospora straminea TaxID=663607 RepID=A0ABP9ER92_9PSEU|nr:APC family permease [Actinomycetospora straminea]MDD7931579.1 APC family permease [Actinomycetospora straminea]
MPDDTANATATDAPGEGSLVRAIGPKLLVFFIIGDILGTTIYALTGTVSERVGGALWLPFLLAFVVAFMTAFSYLELVGKYPRAAGAALYTQLAFRRPFLTFVVAFTVMCSGITSAASAAQAFGGRNLEAIVGELPGWVTPLVVVAFLLMLAVINFRGVGESVRVNVVLTTIELLGLAIVIVLGAWAVINGAGDASRLGQFATSAPDSSIFSEPAVLLAISSATALAFFAMVGFEDSVNMAEETVDPPRTFPRAMLLAMGITATIYLVVALLASTLVPTEELAAAESGALLRVVQTASPSFPAVVFAAITLFAVTNTALINMMMASRLLYGMGRERIIPDAFSKVHPGRRTPWLAIVVTSALAIVLVLLLEISELGSMTSLLLLAVFTLVNIAVLVLRRDEVGHRHFRAPTAVPIVAAVLCAFLASPFSGRPPKEYLFAGILLLLGVALWGVNRLTTGRREDFDASTLGK